MKTGGRLKEAAEKPSLALGIDKLKLVPQRRIKSEIGFSLFDEFFRSLCKPVSYLVRGNIFFCGTVREVRFERPPGR